MENATLRALARASAKLGGVSDYRLAKELGFSQQSLSRYRNGHSQLDDASAVRMAEFLGEPPAQLLAEIQAERTKDEGARAHWLRLAALARAACLVLTFAAAILAGSAMVGESDVSTFGAGSYASRSHACSVQNDIQCVQSTAEITALSMPFFVAVLLLILGVWIPPSGDRKTATPTPTDAH